MKDSQTAEAEPAHEPAVPSVGRPATDGPVRTPAVTLARQVGNRAFTAHALARYQQGEAGHGGIEEQGLGQAGFSAQEVKSTYFGNWLRDFSQMGESGQRPPALMLLLNILALGEFGRELTDADLGGYLPSEHLDNPEGGGSAEDPSASPKTREEALAKLPPQQKAAYEREREAKAAIAEASARSGLPEYIERGKLHAKEQIAEAVTKGEGPEGMQALGNGLHVVEDYFSHSNFTEACIVTLDHAHDPTVKPLMDRLLEMPLGHELAKLVPEENGRIQIQTGTYGPGANQMVSMIEALETELTNGELRRTFIKGSLLYNHVTLEHATATLGSAGFMAKLATFAVKEIAELVDVACNLFGEDQVMRVFGFTTPALDSLLGPLATALTPVSGQQAQAAGLSGPTHSQLAKDAPDSPLYLASRALAVEADKQIGEKIKQVWEAMPKESKEPSPGPPAEQGPPQSEPGGPAPGPPASTPGPPAPTPGAPSSTPGSPAPAPGSPPAPAGAPAPPAAPAPETPQQKEVTSLVDKFVSNPADDTWWEPVIHEAAAGTESG